MDKRWLSIIIILVVGLGCMYLVASSSSNVGSAITIVNDISVTLPHGFKIADSSVNAAKLTDESSKETILVKYIKDGNYSINEYKNEIKAMNKNSSLEITKNKSDDTVHTLYCKNLDTGKEYTLSYFDTYDRTMLIKMENYNDDAKLEKDLKATVDNIQPDYKQSRS